LRALGREKGRVNGIFEQPKKEVLSHFLATFTEASAQGSLIFERMRHTNSIWRRGRVSSDGPVIAVVLFDTSRCHA